MTPSSAAGRNAGCGVEHTVVLRGNAVNYAVAGQASRPHGRRMEADPGSKDGSRRHRLDREAEDSGLRGGREFAERGIERGELVPGVQLLSRTALPGLRRVRAGQPL